MKTVKSIFGLLMLITGLPLLAWGTFPSTLTNAVDGLYGTEIMAHHLNNLEAKVGVDGSAVVTSLDYLLKNSASINPGHKHTPASGGTGLYSYTAGDLLYASGTTTLEKLAKAAAGNVLLSGDAPSWGKVGLTTHVNGTLAVGNGGTGLTTVAAGSYLKGAGAGALAPRTASEVKTDLSLNNVENTALSTWAGSTSLTTLGTVANGTWGGTAVAANKGGTGQTAYAVGDLLYADTTSTLARLADVATGSVLRSGGVDTAPAWGQVNLTTDVSGTLPGANGGTGHTYGGGYQIEGHGLYTNPADSTTYYLNYAGRSPSTTESWRKYIMKSGKIKAINIFCWQSVGTNEASSFYFRLNGSSDTLITDAMVHNASATTVLNDALDISVSAGDYFTIKWVTPAWATNPTSVEIQVDILVQ
jgi:hypothetical protein